MARRPKKPDKHADDPPRPGLPLSDPARGVRIQRYLADAGIASRRHCEQLITEGRVEVNGSPVLDLPIFIDPENDRVAVDSKPVAAPERHIYLMLNKPTRTLSTVMDEPGSDRRTVLDLVDHPSGARLFPVGRLDFDTTGLILLTNDGELANRLTHPRYGIHKTYRALVKGRLEDEHVDKLAEGIFLAERSEGRTVGASKAAHVELTIARRDRDRTTLEISLREGRNRQVRRMLAGVGCPVKKLERVAMGPLKLKGLARGEWRELTRTELGALRKAAGVKSPSATAAATRSKKRRRSRTTDKGNKA